MALLTLLNISAYYFTTHIHGCWSTYLTWNGVPGHGQMHTRGTRIGATIWEDSCEPHLNIDFSGGSSSLGDVHSFPVGLPLAVAR